MKILGRPSLWLLNAGFIFNPLHLFIAGQQGTWYDPSDLSTLFQDAAGTTPVTASGQPVGLMLDKSGRGNHASQPTAASRPIFRDVGGLRYLEFDGVDDFLSTGNIDFTSTNKMSVFAGVRKLSDVKAGTVAELSTNAGSTNGAFILNAPYSNTIINYGLVARGTTRVDLIHPSVIAAPHSAVTSGAISIGAPLISLRVNGVYGAITSSLGAGNFGNHPLYIGRRAGASLPFNGNLYGLIIRGALTSDANVTATERYLAAKTGVTL